LYLLGVSGSILSWFESYLSDRQQFVKINESVSGKKIISHGVPQGSILGPILFFIYVNDIMELKLNSTVYLFADDTALVCSADNYMHLQYFLSEDLQKLSKWMYENRLTMNWDKSSFMLFGNDEYPVLQSIEVGNSRLNRAKSVKYLDLHIDEKLTWVQHINHVVNKIRPMSFILFKLRNFLNREQLLQLYYAYVHSRLSYLCIVWGRSSKKRFKKGACLTEENS